MTGRSIPSTPMTILEELGLLKMDFLGLRTLTVIQSAVQEIERIHGIRLNMEELPENDSMVYDMICQGKTEGVFQLESGGMKQFMRELQPRCLEDMIAGIALYRPGPMDFIPKYIKGEKCRRQGAVYPPEAGADSGKHLRLYRVSGAGNADCAGSGRLQSGQK